MGEAANVTDLQPRQLEQLERKEKTAHKRMVEARVHRLRCEAANLENPSQGRQREFDIAREEEAATRRSFNATVRRRRGFEDGETEAPPR